MDPPFLYIILFFVWALLAAMTYTRGCWKYCCSRNQQDRSTTVLTAHLPTHRSAQLPSHQYASDQSQLQVDLTNIPSAPAMDSEPPPYEEAIKMKSPLHSFNR